MSELLGRPLRPGESVHHRNLIKEEETAFPEAPRIEHGGGTAGDMML
jgi:hypothetical protein